MDAPGGTNVLWTDICTVEFHVAAVNSIFPGNLIQSLPGQIPGIGDQAKGPVQAHRSDEFGVPIHHRASRNTGPTGNALCVQPNDLPFLGGGFNLCRFERWGSGDKVWFQSFQPVDQGFEIHGQILDNGDMTQRLKRDWSGAQVFDQSLAGKPLSFVDH